MDFPKNRMDLRKLASPPKVAKVRRNFKPGDVALDANKSVPLNTWMMGKIIQTRPDSSGTA